MGISTGYIGMLQTIETLKIILGLNKKCKNFLLSYNILTTNTKKKQIYLSRNKKTKILYKKEKKLKFRKRQLSISNQYIIIDLRDKYESKKKHIDRSINIPLLNLKRYQTLKIIKYYLKKNNIALYCNKNYKSIIASHILKNYEIINFILDKNI